MKYRHYLIKYDSTWNDYNNSYDDGYNAFIGTFRVFPVNFPNISRLKIAIDLWNRFHMNTKKFWRYVNFLFVNRYNYSGCYGKLISISTLRAISKKS